MVQLSPIDDAQRVDYLLGSWLDPESIQLELQNHPIDDLSFGLRVGHVEFLGLMRSLGDAPTIAAALEKFKRAALKPKVHRLLVVPYMGDVGDRLCREAGVSWVDLSGNAHIRADKLFIHVSGNSNEFKRVGRPSNVFAAKSSRIARHLLQHPSDSFLQVELADSTGLAPGYTSKIVHRLEELRLILRNENDEVKVRDPDLLLDAWREKYDFSMHRIIKGTVASNNTRDLALALQERLGEYPGEFAATGLAASWFMDKFATHRIVTFFVEKPTKAMLSSLRFHEGEKGANVWLVVPKDEGVFQGKKMVDGLMCVHPVQAYLDVLQHPERGPEAAESLRESQLKWT